MSEKVLGIFTYNLSKSYGERKIFQNLACSFPAGKVSLLIGKNGSGKSTLLRMIAGAESFDEGDVLVDGLDQLKDRHIILDSLFFVNENFIFTLPHKIEKMNEVFGPFYSKWSDETYFEWIKKFQLPLKGQFRALSRGQKMQLLCSIALATNAQYLLLDEMTSVLDAHARHLLLNELEKRSAAGATVVLATNMVLEARELADPDVYVLKDASVFKLTAESIKNFVKIRVAFPNTLPATFWRIPAQKNSDGSTSFITSSEELSKLSKDIYQIDRRDNTVEDFFVFHSAIEAANNEKAA